MPEPSETPFRVYTVGSDDQPQHLASCDDVSLAELLLNLRKHSMIGDASRVGVMYRPVDGEPGEWLVNPFAR